MCRDIPGQHGNSGQRRDSARNRHWVGWADAEQIRLRVACRPQSQGDASRDSRQREPKRLAQHQPHDVTAPGLAIQPG